MCKAHAIWHCAQYEKMINKKGISVILFGLDNQSILNSWIKHMHGLSQFVKQN